MVKTSTLLILAAIAISFFATIVLTKTWIRAARKFGLVGKDMNKLEKKDADLSVLYPELHQNQVIPKSRFEKKPEFDIM